MPVVGFGTWKLDGDHCYAAVRHALHNGYRHIDTAEAYQNEEHIGRAITDSQVPRNEIFLTTKLTSAALGMAEVALSPYILQDQLQKLQVQYVDVYMLHAPGEPGQHLRDVWAELEKAYDQGLAKALGVSNANCEDLEAIWSFAKVKPEYVQNIFKVYKPGEQMITDCDVKTWCEQHDVVFMGYSVINSWPHLLAPTEDPHVLQIAEQVGATGAQVLHRWALQRGAGVIPKTGHLDRLIRTRSCSSSL